MIFGDLEPETDKWLIGIAVFFLMPLAGWRVGGLADRAGGEPTAGGAWFIVTALLLGQFAVGQYIAFFGGLALGGATWLGSVWRAKYTGIWDREE